MVSRRRFVKMGGTMAAAGLMAAGPLGGNFLKVIAGERASAFSKDGFKSLIGKQFNVHDVVTGEKGRLKLVEVKEIANPLDKNMGIDRDSYSVLFENVRGNELGQSNYRFDNDEFGDIDLLMVPVTKDAGYHEILFNNFVT
ncbi:MAG: hypothetical protein OEM82_14045 [Acidobacteriota bacterium]|nr:hypothetical protein [Acidobacteriota bacterium]MDH3531242.1 hypothetical protein [Acidobacteriota bacterium]